MTAFDNIKTNNWPATSNDLEDFLLLKMPLNDTASLTESLPIVAGSKEIFPSKTLTNSGVSSEQTQYVANVKLHTFINGTPSTFKVNGTTVPRGTAANGDVTFTVAVNGGLSSIAWSYDSGNGPYCYMRGIEVDLGDGNGYQLIQDGAFGRAAYSSLVSGTVDSSYPLSNLFGGTIGTGYTNGTRSTNPGTLTLNLSPVFPPAKHYPQNAVFNGSSSFIYHAPDKEFYLGTDDWCIECWFKKDNFTATGELFQLGMEVYYTNNIEISVNTDGAMRYHMYGNGTSQEGFTSSNNVVTAGTWHHMACTRQGTTFRGFLDGVQLGSWTKAANWQVGSSDSAHNSPTIGARTNGSRNAMHVYFGGSIQDFRIYKGVAKYTSSYTPPSAILS